MERGLHGRGRRTGQGRGGGSGRQGAGAGSAGRSDERAVSFREGLGSGSWALPARETPMDRPTGTALLDHFATLEDPRQVAKVLYPLPEILLLLLCATLAGADDVAEIAVWGEENLAFLRRF